MAAKPALDELVNVLDLPVEGQDPLRQVSDQAGGHLLTRQPGGPGIGGVDGRSCQLGCAADVAGTQPVLQAGHAQRTQRSGGLKAGQQHQRTPVAQVQDALQPGADRQQQIVQAVDRASAISD